ncbi:MAG: DJ-1/PfpI family protein [Candidatus Riflebacteria bacterium]|nr:DJ-1/PfpI family protein [Candidatus Riflebacteria bacterium]
MLRAIAAFAAASDPISVYSKETSVNNPSSNTVALVIAPKDFRDEELFVPLEALKKAGFTTVVASAKTSPATGMLGGTITPDKTIDHLRSGELAGILVVGGSGSPEFLWENKPLHALLRNMAATNKPVGAICLSPAVLAKAGLLKGKKATVYKDEKAIDALKKGGAEYSPEACVVDGLIVTADGPKAAEAFAEAFIKLLKLK